MAACSLCPWGTTGTREVQALAGLLENLLPVHAKINFGWHLPRRWFPAPWDQISTAERFEREKAITEVIKDPVSTFRHLLPVRRRWGRRVMTMLQRIHRAATM
uniref:Uncharacterized protein n=1 Tax=Setaria viridis TaxID=4556 RepID=A0A4U6TVB5_SETVI|nr:hypothetical protein SEVIR_7G184500v2 [Setaria viridis]